MKQLLECVPNFSEGRNPLVIDAIAAAIHSVEGLALLHIDPSPAANRTVMTFAGEPDAVIEGAFRAIKAASQHIDMRKQEGVHPRIGATDVCPLIPLQGMSMADALIYADKLAARVAEDLSIPVFLYEHSQPREYRKALPDIRKGQYEGMEAKMQDPRWSPDYGPNQWRAATGATVIGARDILIAFNVSLNTTELYPVQEMAKRMRERGFWEKNAYGERIKKEGLLKHVRAIGWYMADYANAQVSLNILSYKLVSLVTIWETCKTLAAEYGLELVGSELIGLMPLQPLLDIAESIGKDTLKNEEEKVQEAMRILGLNALKPFDPQEKILEWSIKQHLGLEVQLT